MPMCFYLFSGISKRRFLGIVQTVVAAEALCRESSLQGGEFIILAVLFCAPKHGLPTAEDEEPIIQARPNAAR